jgi:TonB C terminal
MKPSGVTSFSIILNQKSLPTNIVLLPYVKKVSGSLVNLHEQQKRSLSNIKISQTVKPQRGTTLAQKKELPKPTIKKVVPVPVPKNRESKKLIPANIKKEVPQLTKLQSKKDEKPSLKSKTQKAVAKRQQPIQKPIAQKQQELVKVEPRSEKDIPSQDNLMRTISSDNQDVIYLGREDLAALVMNERIQKHIEQVWRPPVGVSKDCVCIINVLLDEHGSILELAIEESSHVLPYDIAARSALAQVPFPKAMWGKNLVVTFKQ